MVKRFLSSFLCFILSFTIFLSISRLKTVSTDKGMDIINEAVQNSIISYYSLYGVYPDSFDTLKKFSHLQIDENKYFIAYEIEASNLMPTFEVIEL